MNITTIAENKVFSNFIAVSAASRVQSESLAERHSMSIPTSLNSLHNDFALSERVAVGLKLPGLIYKYKPYNTSISAT